MARGVENLDVWLQFFSFFRDIHAVHTALQHDVREQKIKEISIF